MIEYGNVDKVEDNLPEKIEKTNKENFLSTVFAIIGALMIALLIFVNVRSSCPGIDQSTETVAKSLLQSLQSSTAIYVAQQRVPPEVFSDFLVAEGEATGATTLTLANVSDRLAEVNGIETTKMMLIFDDNYQARYYLEGTDVTANYLNLQSKKEPVLFISKQISPYILLSFIGAYLFFIIYYRSSISIWGIVILCMCVFPLFVPRFSKPAVYLYPEKLTEVNVTLGKAIDITLDVPKYSSKKGWTVMANPNGKLVDLQPELTNCSELDTNRFGMEYAAKACKNNSYPYLYWEGINKFQAAPKSNKGWVVKQGEVAEFLNEKLDYAGFNDKEKRDFLEYWVQKIAALKQEEYFMYFLQTEELESYLPMTVSPQPDSVNRFYIVVSKAKPGQNPVPQELIKFKRKGFTLVDWGGSVLF